MHIREWDGWMESLTQWTWVWPNSGRWWRTGKPGVPQSMESQSWTQLSNWTTTMHIDIWPGSSFTLRMIILLTCLLLGGFPCVSAGKESSCNAGDLGSIPGLGRSPGEGKGYPLQYSGLENSMDGQWGHKELDMTEQLSLYYLEQWRRR